MTLPDPPILVITDRLRSIESLEDRARALFGGGCRWLSLREKDLAEAERWRLLDGVRAIGEQYGATISVHGDVGAARDMGTALHLPAHGDAAAARAAIGARLLGQSCHDASEIARAKAGGVDYVTLSPVFESRSKPGYRSAADLEAIAVAARLPVLALGGVTIDTTPRLASGAFAGIAVMGEAMATREPAAWFARLRSAWGR